MERALLLQLALWREVTRHAGLAELVAGIALELETQVPLDRMWVVGVGEEEAPLLAQWPEGAAPAAGPPAVDWGAVSRFASRGGVALLNASAPGRSALKSLAPLFGGGYVLCGGLTHSGRPEGVVAWRLSGGVAADTKATELLAATLEPLGVAVDMSRRYHELESHRLAAEADRHSALRRLGRETLSDPIIGEHGGLAAAMQRVRTVAPSNLPVLILGETGSGKEVVARAIHERSPRRDGPFVRVNCGAIPPDLIDSQLFGHERGAFTGATEQRQGWFERADGGTLFLDEVGELPLAAQVRLLRVVQEGVLERVGGEAPVHVDCRIAAATHRDLSEMVQHRTFREDLWYRLAVFPVLLPPLRDRPEDLPELVRYLASRAATRFGLPEFEVSEPDLALLRVYHWPGNIRELGAVIDRAALLGQGHRLAISAAMGGQQAGVVAKPERPGAVTAPPLRLDDSIREAIRHALEVSAGRVEGEGGAAELLGLNASTLRSKMRKLGVR